MTVPLTYIIQFLVPYSYIYLRANIVGQSCLQRFLLLLSPLAYAASFLIIITLGRHFKIHSNSSSHFLI